MDPASLSGSGRGWKTSVLLEALDYPAMALASLISSSALDQQVPSSQQRQEMGIWGAIHTFRAQRGADSLDLRPRGGRVLLLIHIQDSRGFSPFSQGIHKVFLE